LPKNFSIKGINWNIILKIVNQYQLNAALQKSDRASRWKELDFLNQEVDTNFASALQEGMGTDQAKTRLIGQLMLKYFRPANLLFQTSVERAEQRDRNLIIAFALAAFQIDNGRYPKKLTELAPNYLKRVPNDLFSNRPLHYRLIKNGYLLYSVGQNEKDEGGRTADDRNSGDDLRIRIPNDHPAQ
jgi:hypothetical protein